MKDQSVEDVVIPDQYLVISSELSYIAHDVFFV